MKKWFPIISFLLANCSLLIAQTGRDSLIKKGEWPVYKHQVSLGLNHVPSSFPFPSFYVDYGYQLAYKRKKESFNYRFGINANQREWDQTNETAWGNHEVAKKHFKINAGLEKQAGKKRYRFNYGADICIYRARTDNLKITRYERYSFYDITYGFAIGPVIGFEYYLFHNFSFATEVNVDVQFNEMMYFKVRDHYYGNRYFYTDIGTHRFGSFSINYSF